MKYLLFIIVCTLFACGQTSTENQTSKDTSPKVISEPEMDERSAQMVTALEAALGGREAYEEIPILQWNFFGSRKWWWNKHTGDVRCESQKSDLNLVMNLQTKEGQVMWDSKGVSSQDSLNDFLEKAYSYWINDSYWLVMPFKLRDPGINLRYLENRLTDQDSTSAEVYELTFDGVGLTPSNKYELYIDPSSGLLVQWDFYRTQQDPEPRFKMPWRNYSAAEGVLFSANRGVRRIEDIEAFKQVPDALFNDLSRTASEILAKNQ